MNTKQTTDLIAIPAGKYIGVPVGMAVLIDAALVAAVAATWPEHLVDAALGSTAAVAGLLVGAVAVAPWKARAAGVWPTVVLAGHGISMGAVILAAVSLYSAARPDALAFLATVALPFPAAMIAQVRLVLGPALGVSRGIGRSAQDNP